MSPKKPKVDEFLTVETIAAKLGVTTRAIAKWCVEGRIPGAFKLGNGKTSAWRIPQSGLDEYLNTRKESAQAGVV